MQILVSDNRPYLNMIAISQILKLPATNPCPTGRSTSDITHVCCLTLNEQSEWHEQSLLFHRKSLLVMS